MKKKIYHIHTDFKFLYDSERFDSERFENILVLVGNKPPIYELSIPNMFFSIEDVGLIDKILSNVNDADLIVLNGLCPMKLKLLKKIKKDYKIAWRFFGYELYGKRKDIMFDSETFEKLEKQNGVLGIIKGNIRKIKRNFINQRESTIRKKIDYILLFSDEEYDFLRKHWKIPTFLKLNIGGNTLDRDIENIKKENTIIIGNSSSPYNNHLEILNMIKQNEAATFNFKLFFSYGSSGKYPQLVKERATGIKNLEFIDKFLSRAEFESIYNSAAALVINSYRQLALANIFTGIRNGVKIYLNPKNCIKSWLENEGFIVFSTDELLADLNNHSIKLSHKQIKENFEALKRLQQKYNKEDFNNRIFEILERK